MEAHEFCTNCVHYLCGTCFRCHLRNKVSRNHTLMEKVKIPKKSNLFCDSCKTDDDEVEAARCCTRCDGWLCGSCCRSHSRNEVSRHHVLLDENNMPRKGITFASSIAELFTDKRDADSKSAPTSGILRSRLKTVVSLVWQW